MTKTSCVGGRLMSNSISIIQFGKKSTKVEKIVEIIRAVCNIGGCNKNRIISK